MSQTSHVLMDEVAGQIQAWWANWRAGSDEGEVAGTSSAKGRASITFRNNLGDMETVRLAGIGDGRELQEVGPGDNFKFAANIKMRRGTRFYLRFWGEFPEGMNYGHGQADYANGDLLAYGRQVSDLTGGVEPFQNTYDGARDNFGPIAILAQTDKVTVGICGDSRDCGLTDLPMPPLGHIGQFPRLVGGRLAYVNVSIPGGLASEFTAKASPRRRELLAFSSHLALGLGANDAVAMDVPATDVLSNLQRIAAEVGRPTIAKTIDPWTDLNGGGNSVDNVRPNDRNRQNLNAMLRDVPAGFVATFDPARVLEGADGRWVGQGATSDWVHETNVGNAYAVAAAGFDYRVFGDPPVLAQVV